MTLDFKRWGDAADDDDGYDDDGGGYDDDFVFPFSFNLVDTNCNF